MRVLVIGAKRHGIESYIEAVKREVSTKVHEVEIIIAETFTEARASVEYLMPDVVHLVSDPSIRRLIYSHGCVELAQLFERSRRPPLVNVQDPVMFEWLRPAWKQFSIDPKCSSIGEAIIDRSYEDRSYRKAS